MPCGARPGASKCSSSSATRLYSSATSSSKIRSTAWRATCPSGSIGFDGFVHSIAFADYAGEPQPFHETAKRDFLRAFDISCFSLVAVSNALKDLLAPDASVVTISISTTRMASENYGYMAPIKAALDSSLAFLAKSFSRFSQVRFNAVAPGLLKTSASAGIPGYVDSYLYAEQATLRKQAVQTEEVANVAAFLLSPRSSGINAQRLVVDAGMSTNYFDAEPDSRPRLRRPSPVGSGVGQPAELPTRRKQATICSRKTAGRKYSARGIVKYRRRAPSHATSEAS